MSFRRQLILVGVVGALAIGPIVTARAQGRAPAQTAEALRVVFIEAQFTAAQDAATAALAVTTAADTYRAELAPTVARFPAPAAEAQTALAALEDAARSGDAVAVAAARAMWWTALLSASHDVVIDAIATHDIEGARSWLAVREFRQATRFERTGVDATLALDQWAAGTLSSAAAAQAVDADLLDAYQTRLNQALVDLLAADMQGFAARRAETAALARGYFYILEPVYQTQRGDDATHAARARFDALSAAGTDLPIVVSAIRADLAGFRAAPLSPQAQQRRTGQLLRYLQLVPIEYARALSGGRITQDIELQEAISFRDAAEAAFVDLRPDLERLAGADAQAIGVALDGLETLLDGAAQSDPAPDAGAVQQAVDAVVARLKTTLPADWQSHSSEAEFDVVAVTLNQMETAVRAGAYDTAESARLEAYAIMETGPEARLMAFAPQMKVVLEELFWNGQGEHKGLAYLLRTRAPLAEIRDTRKALDAELREAEELLGQQSAPVAVATNAGLIMFREGLEAVVILASLMSSLKGASLRLRRPLWLGSAAALVATAVTWLVFRSILAALARYGEMLEAVVSLVAIGVLLLITNWFFHKLYWTDWIASFHSQKRRLLAGEAGLWLGLASLGFTSVYREGFETALFLQALVLDAGATTVMLGVALGAVAVAVVGILVFRLQVNLPQKKLLIVTGVLIGGVLLIMVGTTTHILQVIGWLPIHVIGTVTLPYWLGTWFGVYATWEGLALQILAAAFVLGSYALAEGGKAKDRTAHAVVSTTR